MIEKLLDPILAPFRELRSKLFGIKNIADNLKGDVGRVKRMVTTAKNDVTAAKEKAEAFHAQAKGGGPDSQKKP